MIEICSHWYRNMRAELSLFHLIQIEALLLGDENCDNARPKLRTKHTRCNEIETTNKRNSEIGNKVEKRLVLGCLRCYDKTVRKDGSPT